MQHNTDQPADLQLRRRVNYGRSTASSVVYDGYHPSGKQCAQSRHTPSVVETNSVDPN